MYGLKVDYGGRTMVKMLRLEVSGDFGGFGSRAFRF